MVLFLGLFDAIMMSRVAGVHLLLLRLLAIAVPSSAFSSSMGPRSMTGGAFAVVGIVGRRGRDGVAMPRTRTTRGRRRKRLIHSLASRDDEGENYDDDDDDEGEEGGGAAAPLLSLETSATTRAMGERLIFDAAYDCGATAKMMNVEWKGERIVVTVDVYADKDYDHDVEDYDHNDDDDEDSDEDYDEDYDEIDWDGDDDVVGRDDSDDEELDIAEFENTGEGDDDFVGKTKRRRVDLTQIARAINEAFARDAPDGPGYAVAMTHEIEVTTPIFDGLLRGRRMFDSYRGFDVIVEHFDGVKRGKRDDKNGKRNPSGGRRGGDDDALCDDDGSIVEATTMDDDGQRKIKTTQGKLVGREYHGVDGDGVTTINVKGRAVRIRNDDILNVSLPKAKREKGAK
jgi:hypothetical protein